MKDKKLSQLYERREVRKARVTVDDNSHVLTKHNELLSSGGRFRVPKLSTVRLKILMQSIAFLNRQIRSNVRAFLNR